MAIAIMQDKYNETAVMYCNTTDWAFGPVHSSDNHTAAEELELFLLTLVNDPRLYSSHELETLYHGFRQHLKHCACGAPYLEIKSTMCAECAESEDE